MSGPSHSVTGTLTGGIQDVSAILPIIGTDQCESHVGSALEGGYLYAAASPLSIFGSLGMVKVGIAVLISSISIPAVPTFLRRRYKKLPQGRWLGARILANAGFKLQGKVASLIGMEEVNRKRFKAEERLLEILEEKHIDDPESILIEWHSQQWNIMLVLCTLLAAGMSLAPYIALISGPTTWRPPRHLPWLFPLLRTTGSSLAAVCCQFLIQSRVIFLMKSRVLFMMIHRRLNDNVLKDNKIELDTWLKEHLHWDADLPSEQCIWRLEQFLSSERSLTHTNVKENFEHISIEMETFTARSSTFSIPSWTWSPAGPPSFPKGRFNKNFVFDCNTLQHLHRTHFPNPMLDRNMVLISWIVLFLSIPASIAGYVGCFTLVSASPGNGPLIWLGLEAALSIIRILVWAWNPKFDENTGVDVKLKLTDQQPMVTTEDYNPHICDLDSEERKPIVLVPERQFLEWITPYTGPLEHFCFRNAEHIALYFTLTADYTKSDPLLSLFDATSSSSDAISSKRELWSLILTILDVNKRNAFTLSTIKEVYTFFNATTLYNPISGEMEANLHTVMHDNDLHRTKDPSLFEALLQYYKSVLSALGQPSTPNRTATLGRKWDLFPLATGMQPLERQGVDQTHPTLSVHHLLYLDRGYEHHLKSQLTDLWGRWIVASMESIYEDALCDCYEALADKATEEAKFELRYLDELMAWEWTRREHACLELSTKLEDILRARMELCINEVGKEGESVKLREWMWREFDTGRRKRMDKEQRDAMGRMEKAGEKANDRAQKEGWEEWGYPRQRGLKFIQDQWTAGITGGHATLQGGKSELDELIEQSTSVLGEEFKRRFRHWHPQRENERLMMEAAVARWDPNVDGQRDEMDRAYEYPEPNYENNWRFVALFTSLSNGKACAAIVYDARNTDEATVCGVIQKSTTRSVINVDPAFLASIPANDHLLFLSCDGGEAEPSFIQRNRDRWWEQAEQTKHNSSTFYFSPQGISQFACWSGLGTIAHISIFLINPSRVRLRLLHFSYLRRASVSVQEGGTELARISKTDICEESRLQDLDLPKLGPGRHQLEVVVDDVADFGLYNLRDILINIDEGSEFPVAGIADVENPIQIATSEDRSADGEPTSNQNEELSEVASSLQILDNREELNGDP